jgi:hypothetical protein
LQRIRGLDAEVGIFRKPDENAESFLRRVNEGPRVPGSRLIGQVLVETLQRVAVLEAKVERLEAQLSSRE